MAYAWHFSERDIQAPPFTSSRLTEFDSVQGNWNAETSMNWDELPSNPLVRAAIALAGIYAVSSQELIEDDLIEMGVTCSSDDPEISDVSEEDIVTRWQNLVLESANSQGGAGEDRIESERLRQEAGISERDFYQQTLELLRGADHIESLIAGISELLLERNEISVSDADLADLLRGHSEQDA